MQKVDRMLIAILAGVVGLVLIAFAILLLRPKAAYLPDGTPDAAVHNYLLALQLADESRAYSYVSPAAKGYPYTLADFQRSIRMASYAFDSLKTATFAVGPATVSGDTASVLVTQANLNSGNLFGSSGNSTTITFRLRRNPTNGAWKIVTADSLWAYCWDFNTGC